MFYNNLFVHIYMISRKCNGYPCWKWTWKTKFKSWMRLIAFHMALIPLGKVWIQLFSLQLWANSRADWLFKLGMGTGLGEEKLISNPSTLLKNWPCVTSCSYRGVGKYIYNIKYSNLIQIICIQFYSFKCSYQILIIYTQLYGFKKLFLFKNNHLFVQSYIVSSITINTNNFQTYLFDL